jgi:hypothetical protein
MSTVNYGLRGRHMGRPVSGSDMIITSIPKTSRMVKGVMVSAGTPSTNILPARSIMMWSLYATALC